MNNKYKHKRYVAHFDMLGFKSAIYRNHDEAWGALSDLRLTLDKMLSYGIRDKNLNKNIVGRIRGKIFSDSILLFSLADEVDDLISILFLSAQLYYDALNLCLLLRGGISLGDFYINEELDLYCGKPFVEAYNLSETSQWSGILLSESVANEYFNTRTGSAFFNSDFIFEYILPLENQESKKHWVINWPKVYAQAIKSDIPIDETTLYQPFERLYGPYKDLNETDKRKYANTVNFINLCLKDLEKTKPDI